MAEAASSAAEAPASNDRGRKKWLSIAITGALVGAIISFECVLVFLYLPGGGAAAKVEAKTEVAAAEHSELRDVDLGKFSLTVFDPNSNAPILVEFRLIGALVAGRSEKQVEHWAAQEAFNEQGSKAVDVAADDNAAFEKLFKQDKNRFRDQVIAIIGNAQISDLSDPALGFIKRQILAKTNSLLGEPLLKDVQFSDFAVMQQ